MLSSELRNRLTKNAKQYYTSFKKNNDELREKATYNLRIDQFGADCIGSGTGRNVFDMRCLGKPEYALKLAKPHSRYDGRRQNKREITLYNNSNIDVEKKQHLVPVLAHGPEKYWLIMKKGSNEFKLDHEQLLDMKYDLKSYIWEDDIIKENIVMINGSLKLCDYGTKQK